MNRRRICKLPFGIRLSDGATVEVALYRDSDTREYIVRLWINDELIESADYFTNDYDDAIATARSMLDQAVHSEGN